MYILTGDNGIKRSLIIMNPPLKKITTLAFYAHIKQKRKQKRKGKSMQTFTSWMQSLLNFMWKLSYVAPNIVRAYLESFFLSLLILRNFPSINSTHFILFISNCPSYKLIHQKSKFHQVLVFIFGRNWLKEEKLTQVLSLCSVGESPRR